MTKPKKKSPPKKASKKKVSAFEETQIKVKRFEDLASALVQARARIAQLEKMLAKLRLAKIKTAVKAKERLEAPPAILEDEDEL